jgi:DNA double-strand break repair helicase HerA and related ATPase
VGVKYDSPVNRESAHEILSQRAVAATAPAENRREDHPGEERSGSGSIRDVIWGTRRRQGMVETAAKQAARTVGSQIGRQILRGVLGGILGGSRRR